MKTERIVEELDRRQRHVVTVVTRIIEYSKHPVMNAQQVVDEVNRITYGLDLKFSAEGTEGICQELFNRFGV